jgi:hypothetical protein
VAKGRFRSLSDVVADGAQWLVVNEREHREQFKQLCLTIVGLPRVRSHLLMGMCVVALHHTKIAGELEALRAAVSSVMNFLVGSSCDVTFLVEVVDWRSYAHSFSSPA